MKRNTGPPHSPAKIESVPLDQLHPYPENPRSWTTEQLEHLKTSIKNNDWLVPLVVNRAKSSFNTILSGHMRAAAAGELGYKEVPAIFVVVNDKEREREIVIRLNKNVGSWDFERLKSFEIDFLVDVGFDPSELAGFWDDMLETEEDAFDQEEELAKLGEPTVKPGDHWKLGSHYLYCGDATDPAAVARLVGMHRMDMFIHDPVFNIGLDYDRGFGTKKKRYGGTTNDHKSKEDYRSFLKAILANSLIAAKSDVHCFCWSDEAYTGMLQDIYAELGIEYRRTCLWIKNNANITPQIAFSKTYECCQYGIIGKPYLSERVQNLTEILNREIATGNRTLDDILDIVDLWICKRIPSNEYEHAAQKPVSLMEKPLRRCTKPGDNVMDLCAGSGTTLIACEQMKRRAFLMEIEPRFCSLIIHRFEALTGLKASLLKP